VNGAATFASLLSIRRATASLPSETRRVVIDLRDAAIVDHTFLNRLDGFAREWNSVELEFEGLDSLRAASDHPWSTRRRHQAS